MNQLNSKYRFALVLVLMALLTGCSGSRHYESTGEYLDNAMLTTKVKASILGDSKLKLLQINVESFKGTVLLSGFVDSPIASERAVQLARTVKGVREVKNNLVVKP